MAVFWQWPCPAYTLYIRGAGPKIDKSARSYASARTRAASSQASELIRGLTAWLLSRPSGALRSSERASAGVPRSQAPYSSGARTAGTSCVAVWIDASSVFAGTVRMAQPSMTSPSSSSVRSHRGRDGEHRSTLGPHEIRLPVSGPGQSPGIEAGERKDAALAIQPGSAE